MEKGRQSENCTVSSITKLIFLKYKKPKEKEFVLNVLNLSYYLNCLILIYMLLQFKTKLKIK